MTRSRSARLLKFRVATSHSTRATASTASSRNASSKLVTRLRRLHKLAKMGGRKKGSRGGIRTPAEIGANAPEGTPKFTRLEKRETREQRGKSDVSSLLPRCGGPEPPPVITHRAAPTLHSAEPQSEPHPSTPQKPPRKTTHPAPNGPNAISCIPPVNVQFPRTPPPPH